jgi:hypothetical protein
MPRWYPAAKELEAYLNHLDRENEEERKFRESKAKPQYCKECGAEKPRKAWRCEYCGEQWAPKPVPYQRYVPESYWEDPTKLPWFKVLGPVLALAGVVGIPILLSWLVQIIGG